MPSIICNNIFIIKTIEVDKIPGMMMIIIILCSFQIFDTLYAYYSILSDSDNFFRYIVLAVT